MKNILFSKLKFLVGSFLLFSFLENQFTFSVAALSYTDVYSPILQNYHTKTVLNKDNLPIGDVKAHFQNDDKFVKIRFEGLPNIEDDEKYVVVFKDVYGYKEKYYAHLNKETKDCFVILRYFRTFEDILLYKQKNSEEDDEEKEENFVCRTGLLLGPDYNYNRDTEETIQKITPINKEGTVIKSMPLGNFRVKNTPNTFCIEPVAVLKEGGGPTTYGYIVLKEDQQDMLTEDQKVIPLTYNDDDLLDYRFNFYLPPEIKEFTFIVYRKNINDLRYKYNIVLDRK